MFTHAHVDTPFGFYFWLTIKIRLRNKPEIDLSRPILSHVLSFVFTFVPNRFYRQTPKQDDWRFVFRDCCPLWKSLLWPSLHYESSSPAPKWKTPGFVLPSLFTSWPFRLVLTGCVFVSIERERAIVMFTHWLKEGSGLEWKKQTGSCFKIDKTRRLYTIDAIQTHPQDCHMIGQITPSPPKFYKY